MSCPPQHISTPPLPPTHLPFSTQRLTSCALSGLIHWYPIPSAYEEPVWPPPTLLLLPSHAAFSKTRTLLISNTRSFLLDTVGGRGSKKPCGQGGERQPRYHFQRSHSPHTCICFCRLKARLRDTWRGRGPHITASPSSCFCVAVSYRGASVSNNTGGKQSHTLWKSQSHQCNELA